MPGSFRSNSMHGVTRVPKSMPVVRAFTDNVPSPPLPYTIRGVTKDGAGAPLGNCDVHLFRTADDSEAAQGVSDANGNYRLDASSAIPHYAVAYKPGAPDVAGTTVNTLVGTPD